MSTPSLPIHSATLVTVLRHGEVEGTPFVLRGRSDPPLSESGWAQMHAVVEAPGKPAFTEVRTSPRLRCHAFARAYAEERKLPLVVDERIAEIDFGEWEELTPDAAARRDPELWARFSGNPLTASPPGGEKYTVFRNRVGQALDDWHGLGGHVLVVSHAGVLRALISLTLGLPPEKGHRIAFPAAGSLHLSLLPEHPPCVLGMNQGAAP